MNKGNDMKKILSPYENNFVFRILFDRIGKKIGILVACVLIFFIIPFLIMLIVSVFENSVFLKGNDVGFLEDIPIIEMMFMLAIVLYIAYLFFNKYSQLHLKLRNAIDFSVYDEQEYEQYIAKMNRFVKGDGRWLKYRIILHILCLLGSVYFALIYAHFNITLPWDVWRFSTHPINFFIFTIYQLIMGGYIIPALFWRFLAIIYSMKDSCKTLSEKNALRIIPLSPDKAGGLRPLGDLALTFHFILVLPLIHIVISVYCWGMTLGSIIGILGYTPFVIAVFFLPLSGAHNVMKNAKEKELQRISNKFNEYYFLFTEDKNVKDLPAGDDDLAILQMMDKLRTSYEVVDKMPVWPFDLSIIRRFVTSIVLPFILIVVELFLEKII